MAGETTPRDSAEVEAAVLAAAGPIRIRGGGSKPALSDRGGDGETTLATTELAAITEYLPSEYTVSVLAGTSLREVIERLAAEGQHLPFDPLRVEAGATVGGTIAAGTSGPGRLRYGGVRDFLLGVSFVDGRGRLLRGGGKVVKNAAGFDLPKLMVGSLGRYGVLVEATFKVFPSPAATSTLEAEGADLASAIAAMEMLLTHPIELIALDLHPPARLRLRLGGFEEALAPRLERIQGLLARSVGDWRFRRLVGDAEEACWREARELAWADELPIFKLPTTLGSIERIEEMLGDIPAPRVYSAGGAQLMLAWPHERRELERRLEEAGARALALIGEPGSPFAGAADRSVGLESRVRGVFDPDRRFV